MCFVVRSGGICAGNRLFADLWTRGTTKPDDRAAFASRQGLLEHSGRHPGRRHQDAAGFPGRRTRPWSTVSPRPEPGLAARTPSWRMTVSEGCVSSVRNEANAVGVGRGFRWMHSPTIPGLERILAHCAGSLVPGDLVQRKVSALFRRSDLPDKFRYCRLCC